MVLEEAPESPLDYKEINSANIKGNQMFNDFPKTVELRVDGNLGVRELDCEES